MSNRWISVFAVTAAALFVFGSAPSLGTNSKAAASAKRSSIDFCCLAGLSCCYIPPGGGGAPAKNTLPTSSEHPVQLP